MVVWCLQRNWTCVLQCFYGVLTLYTHSFFYLTGMNITAGEPNLYLGLPFSFFWISFGCLIWFLRLTRYCFLLGLFWFWFWRPTRQLEWWDGGEILGGRDELAGGTWLACSRDGRVAFLTNVREVECLPDAKSRGDLPSRFLQVISFCFC